MPEREASGWRHVVRSTLGSASLEELTVGRALKKKLVKQGKTWGEVESDREWIGILGREDFVSKSGQLKNSRETTDFSVSLKP